MCNVNSKEIKELKRILKENEDNSKKEIEKLQQENEKLKQVMAQISGKEKETDELKRQHSSNLEILKNKEYVDMSQTMLTLILI